MPVSASSAVLRVALIGNPNTGKSTLFGALVGVRQHVGNYPGVTVEKKTGQMQFAGKAYELIDLPGLYSLAPRSRDEMVAVDVLLGCRGDASSVDAVVCIADASNLQRGLYLVSQALEVGLPTVLVVNMIDIAARRGIRLDLERLAKQLGIPVVAVQANRKIGISELKTALAEVVGSPPRPRESPFPIEFEHEVTLLQALLDGHAAAAQRPAMPRCLVRRLLLDREGYLQSALLTDANGHLRQDMEAARDRLAEQNCAVPAIETAARYQWAHRVLEGAVNEPEQHPVTATDRIDRLLTHRLWGTLVFAVVMVVMFQAVFVWAQPAMRGIDALEAAAGNWVEAHMGEGPLRSLLVGGLIGGVGSVFSFLPQILILFCFIGVLEDCGYMARAAYLMDRLMARVGLSGKSFIPMLSSFACAVPGIMAARVIENERDRLTTILVSPLLTCSARLPIYALLIAAFIPQQAYLGGLLNLQGLTLAGLYALGILAAVMVAMVLKRTLLRGVTPPFLLELPSYKWPSLQTVFYRVVQRGWVFLRTAGTLILAISILIWAALYYPHQTPTVQPLRAQQQVLQTQLEQLDRAGAQPAQSQRQELTARLDHLQRQIDGEYQRHSVLGRLGRWIEPAVKPLGWDWRIGCAVLASLPAREIVVATLGVMYNAENDSQAESSDDSTHLRTALRSAVWDDTGQPVFNVPVALSIMVFFALCAQCAATLAVIKRETNSWRWPAFCFAYMTTLAYLGALGTYQVGMWIMKG
jgi:ferrous iron transport protein B